MKKFNFLFTALVFMCTYFSSEAQLCSGVKGPNLLGAKGTFSPPFITVNHGAASCLHDGAHSYSPLENVGNALEGCSVNTGNTIPCSDYTYTAANKGMNPEFTYSLLKVMGDETGSNCLHDPIWRAKDHTGDGGYFMAVNGAPNYNYSPIFYQIKQIPVCIGTNYEFSAWVINMMPSGTTGEAPSISFVVNGDTVGRSGPIAYDGQWHQVGGSFIAKTAFVDLQVVNATRVAGGNDLGLDDISFRVCQSRIEVEGARFTAEGTSSDVSFTVSDPLRQNTFYKFQFSTDGGQNYYDNSPVYNAEFGTDNTYKVNYKIFDGVPVVPEMNGYIFRMVVSTSVAGLDDPDCIYFNDYRLIVVDPATLPVELTSFSGTYANGTANLSWSTAQEINSDRFELYRSFDGVDFSLAGTVAAAGTSSTTQKYKYADAVQKSSGYLYYKLKQIDKDGKFTFSNVVKLAVNSVATTGLQLFPNPVVNSFTASFHASTASKGSMVIRNATGQTVYSRSIDIAKGNNSIVVDNATLSRGMYYITITGENIHFNGKLQKQ